MPRTNADAVKAILKGNYDAASAPDLTPFISAANTLVNQLDTADTGNLADDDTLTTLETWLGAHFYQVMDNGYQSRSTGKASGSFRGQTQMYLDSTLYGQQAKILDPTGFLTQKDGEAQRAGRKRVGVFWAGKDDPDKLTYDERN